MNKILSKVSIVLPTYNGSKYIRKSIDSCLNQTYKNLELIIVDDGSTDKTPEIIQSYTDGRIKYIRHKKNKGLPFALNTGFTNATGEYLTWTSDDNYYSQEAIEKMLTILKTKDCDFVYCDFYRFSDEKPSDIKLVKLPDILNLNNQNGVGACFLYTEKVKNVTGNYDHETVLAEDYDFWIRVSKNFLMCHIPEPLYFYREHINSLSFSRIHEIRIADILVRIRNKVLDISIAVNLLSNLTDDRYPNLKYFKVSKIINKIRFSRKINEIVNDFQKGKVNFKETKLKLEMLVK